MNIINVDLDNLILNPMIKRTKHYGIYESVGEDPYFELGKLKTGIITSIVVTLCVDKGELIEVYWQDDFLAPFTPEKRARHRLKCREFGTYQFDLNPMHLEIKKIRIDPTNATGKIEIRKVEVHYSQSSKCRPKMVNVGCGPKDHKQGWINVDIQPFKGVDVVMDVTKEWNFKDVDYVFAEHFIEHLDLESGVQFLYNAGKSLRQGGWIRISTPNVEWVLKSHYDFGSTSEESLTKSVYSINRAFYGWQHRFLYSPFLLKKVLTEIGYVHIRENDYRVSAIKEFQGIEQHGRPSQKDGSSSVIIVEAMRDERISYPMKFLDYAHEMFIKYSKAKG